MVEVNEKNEFYIDTYNLYILLNQQVDNIIEKSDYDLSFGQYILLKYIHTQTDNKVSQKDLFHWSCLRKATVSQHLKNLSNKGFIMHYRLDTDNRCKEIVLTNKSIECISQIDKAMYNLLLTKIPFEELKKYTDILKKLTKLMEEKKDDKKTNAFH